MASNALLDRVLIHCISPGDSPDRLAEECLAIGLDLKNVGIEVDVVKRKAEGICVASRDGNLVEPIGELLDRFHQTGFGGEVMLDIIERRTASAVLQAVQAGTLSPKSLECLACVNPTVLFFKRPDFQSRYAIEEVWDPERLIVLSQYQELMEGFAGSGATLQWEPFPDDDYRSSRAAALAGYDRIFYKTPFCSITALFDAAECAMEDFHFFQKHGVLDRLVIFGSLSHVRQVRTMWQKELKRQDSTNC